MCTECKGIHLRLFSIAQEAEKEDITLSALASREAGFLRRQQEAVLRNEVADGAGQG